MEWARSWLTDYLETLDIIYRHGATALPLIEDTEVIPAGAIMPYAGSVIPAGWLVCDGSAVSRTGQAALFTALGTTWGVGDGVTTFNIPDLRDRVPIGVSPGGLSGNRPTARTLAQTAGEETHTLVLAEVPTGITTLNDPKHNHRYNLLGDSGGSGNIDSNVNSYIEGTTGIDDPGPTTTDSTGITLTDHAGNGAHNVMQPFAVIFWLIHT
jgi:microcystin-dependent protein